MKTIMIALGISLLASCSDSGRSGKTTDSVNINTTESNKADGGPNNGLGDTNKLNRTTDTVTNDTSNKK